MADAASFITIVMDISQASVLKLSADVPSNMRRSPTGSGLVDASPRDDSNAGPARVNSSTMACDQDTDHNASPGPSRKRNRSTSDVDRHHDARATDKFTPDTRSKVDEDKTGTRRAAQACVRCRKQKLKCVGGNPCDRCVKSMNTCDFGHVQMTMVPVPPGSNEKVGAEKATARLEQLESSVADLLAGLARGSQPTSLNDGDLLRQFTNSVQNAEISANSTFVGGTTRTGPTWPTLSSSLQWPPSLDTTQSHKPSSSTQSEESAAHRVRFRTSPHQIPAHSCEISASTLSESTLGSQLFDDTVVPATEPKKPKSREPDPAERLAAVSEQPYDPPFKALAYEPKIWDNREASRMNSPERAGPQLLYDEPIGPPHWHDHQGMRRRATPLSTGIVDMREAEALFQFFVDHCHAFIPVVNIALDDVFNVIQTSPALFSAILAIAARFYPRATQRFSRLRRGVYPVLGKSVPHRLANLAEMHVGYTILAKSLALSDVQAILLMAAWGLQPEGRGPDAWIITGHAARVARRLGVHRLLARATDTARQTQVGTDEWQKLAAFLPQWRTWLCWYGFDNFLSLGFGRPQSEFFGFAGEDAILQIRTGQTLPTNDTSARIALHGDVYISGLVSLSQIGRDLTKWGLLLANPERMQVDQNIRNWAEKKDLSLKNMFRELNGRLDDWSKLWVWTGSPYALYLGSSVRIARVQAEHLRLCLNSYALKAGADNDEYIGRCLKKALNAAMATVQTHFESSQTDLALSFATDYLTIALAQSAFFLVRISCAPESVRKVIDFDLSVLTHYLKMSVDLLESVDMTENRLPSFLAKTIRDIALAAGITYLGATAHDEEPSGEVIPTDRGSLPTVADPTLPLDPIGQAGQYFSSSMTGSGNIRAGHPPGPMPTDTVDFTDLFNDGQMFDLSSLLGLPGDHSARGDINGFWGPDGTGFDDDGNMAEFRFDNGVSGGSGDLSRLGEPAWPSGSSGPDGLSDINGVE